MSGEEVSDSEVVLKESIPDPTQTDLAPECNLQHLSDTVRSAQNDGELHPETEWTYRKDHDKEISERCISMESNCKDTKYFYHYDSEGYNEANTLACNESPIEGNSTQQPTVNEKCNQEKEIPLVNHHKNYIHYFKSKKMQHNDDSSNADQDQPKYSGISEEHTYPRKQITNLSTEPHLEMSYSYFTGRENISKKIVDTYPEGRSFIQRENLPDVNQDQCTEKSYDEYVKDINVYQKREMPHDNHEMCVVKEYVYAGSSHVYQDKDPDCSTIQDTCQDTYHRYKLHNEGIYQTEATASMEKSPSQEQHHIYHPDEAKFYNRDELASTTECENYQDRSFGCTQNNINSTIKTSIISEEESYQEIDLQDTKAFQRKESSLSKEDNDYIFKEDDTHQKDETSAVDLRIVRSTPSVESQSPSNNTQEPVNNSLLQDNFCHIDHLRESSTISQTKFDQENNSSKISYIIPDQVCYEEEYSNSTQLSHVNETFDCNTQETENIEYHNFWDASTNTEPTTVEDKESQTRLTEVKDVAVQTDIKPTILPLAFLKNIQEEIVKYTCPICQRVYISRHSFDRHLKTHEKEKTNNVIANVRFTTEAKLQICKRAGKTKQLKTHNSIIIQVPRSIFQCGMCERNFPNQREKDNHDCICKPFPLIKCPECHIKFYTTGALNEHISIVHKKENAYYCIFCNKSFNDGYNFHLHLDEHLSMQ